jgi:hypothetical protein
MIIKGLDSGIFDVDSGETIVEVLEGLLASSKKKADFGQLTA